MDYVRPGNPALLPLYGRIWRPYLPIPLNAKDKSTFVKFHWKPKLGLQSVVWNEAVKINGADPDFHRRDLWQAIQSGHFPEWELSVLKPVPAAEEAFLEWIERLDREFANRDPEHRSNVVREELHQLYLGCPYAAPDPAAPLAMQTLVHSLDPRNATLEPETYGDARTRSTASASRSSGSG